MGGIVTLDGNDVTVASLEKLCSAMKNRGSDTQNIWSGDGIGMVHKQLWTTLESKHENQPLIDDAAGLVLTADARIDNRDELLSLLGEHLNNRPIITDVDIILAAYKVWKECCVNYLIGDFSFAIWDKTEEKLFCARDHLGIKPFNYLESEKAFYFASEINALFISSGITKKLNILETQHFLESSKIARDATFFEQIKRLVPGHTLILQEGNVKIQRYWFPESILINKSISLEEAKSTFHSLIEEATRVRLRCAYGVGCEISGGLDSSTILSLAVKHKPDITAFASIYGDLVCDESEFIQAITEKLNVIPIITQADKLDYQDVDSLANYYKISPDWPGNLSFLENTDECRKAKKRDVRVILTGQGGDHVASGMPDRLTDYLRSGSFSRLFHEYKVNPFGLRTITSYFISPFLPLWVKKIARLLMGRPVNNPAFSPLAYCSSTNNKRNHVCYAQAKTLYYICGENNLQWMDINPHNATSGRFDIEFRHPFFDKRVVEFMLSLPSWLKTDGAKDKIVLREALKTYLPELIYKRDDKAEFTPIIELQLLASLRQQKYLSILLKGNSAIVRAVRYNRKSSILGIWKDVCLAEWIKHNNFETSV